MNIKGLGIILAIIGILMIVYTGFNYVTTEKVVDIGSIQMNAKKNNPVQWSPIVGVVLLAGGILVIVTSKKSRS